MLDVRTCLMDARDLSLEAGVGGRAHRPNGRRLRPVFRHARRCRQARCACVWLCLRSFLQGREQGTLPRFHPIEATRRGAPTSLRIGLASHQPSENCRQAARFEARAAIGISGAIGVARFGPAAWIGQGAERIGAPLEDRLTAHQLLEFSAPVVPDQASAGWPNGRCGLASQRSDLRTKIALRRCLTSRFRTSSKCKIGRRHRGPAGEDGQRTNDDPDATRPTRTGRPPWSSALRPAGTSRLALGPGEAARLRVVHHRAGTQCNGEHNAGHDGLEHGRRHTNGVRVCNVVGLRPVGHQRLHGGRVPPPSQAADWTKPALIISNAPHSLSSRASVRTSSACPSTDLRPNAGDAAVQPLERLYG